MKRLSILFSFLLFAYLGNAQVKGKVEGDEGKISGPATVELVQLSDATVAKTVITDSLGNFSIQQVKNGSYQVRISATGFETAYSPNFQFNGQPVELEAIRLVRNIASMAQVTITSRKPLIEQKAGKILVNVAGSPSSAGLNALELLEQSPGVEVDNNGNISLKGKQGVMVLIDGKPSYLSGADLAALLKGMSASNLSQIEIMSNPPARYDAAGNSGIINIKTKKQQNKGFSGNISGGMNAGFYTRHNESLNLNYRGEKLNLFSNYSTNSYEGFNSMEISRNFYSGDGTIADGSSFQISRPHWKGTNHNIKLGMDYNIGPKTIIGATGGILLNDVLENPQSNSTIRDVNGNILFSLLSANDNTEHFRQYTANLNFLHKFDSTGRELSADADYIHYNKDASTLLQTRSFDADGHENGNMVQLAGSIPASIRVLSGKVDYVHPFANGIKMETGLKSSYTKTDNLVNYLRHDGSSWKYDERSNHFIYEEQIHAAYLTGSRELGKWNIAAGLRMEHTKAEGLQVRNDSSFKREYTNLFPNLGVSFRASDKNQFNFSYSRRIDRPDYESLNPFTFFLDSLTYGQGNPYLQPQFTHNVELSHSFKRLFTTTLNYSITNDVISEIMKQEPGQKITYQTRENLSSLKQYGIAVMSNFSPLKWLQTSMFLNVSYNHYSGVYNSLEVENKFTLISANIRNNISLKNGWSAELVGFYRGAGGFGLFQTEAMGLVNAGVSKKMLKDKGQLRLGVTDIFNTMRMNGSAKYGDVDLAIAGRRDSRQVSVSFSYRFGNAKAGGSRRKTGSAETEQSRISTGEN